MHGAACVNLDEICIFQFSKLGASVYPTLPAPVLMHVRFWPKAISHLFDALYTRTAAAMSMASENTANANVQRDRRVVVIGVLSMFKARLTNNVKMYNVAQRKSANITKSTSSRIGIGWVG